jgi:hypothetical protein
MTRVTTLLITGIIATTFLTGCNDAQRLYDRIEVDQVLNVPAEFEGGRTVAGVPGVTCAAPLTYGLVVTHGVADSDNMSRYHVLFATDETGVVRSKLYLEQTLHHGLSLIPGCIEYGERETMLMELAPAPWTGERGKAWTDDTLHAMADHLLDQELLEGTETGSILFLTQPTFWECLYYHEDVSMQSDAQDGPAFYVEQYHAAGRRTSRKGPFVIRTSARGWSIAPIGAAIGSADPLPSSTTGQLSARILDTDGGSQ